MLNDRIAQRKRGAHQDRRQPDFEQHRTRVVPETGETPRQWHGARERRLDGVTRGLEVCSAVRREPAKDRDDQQALHRHEELRRTRRALVERAADERTHTYADEQDREDEREDRAEAAEQDAEVTKPDDLHAHAGESGKHQRERRPDHDLCPVVGPPKSGHERCGRRCGLLSSVVSAFRRTC